MVPTFVSRHLLVGSLSSVRRAVQDEAETAAMLANAVLPERPVRQVGAVVALCAAFCAGFAPCNGNRIQLHGRRVV